MSTIIYLFRIYLKYLDHRIWFLILFSLFIAVLDGIGLSMLMPLLQSVDIEQTHNESNFLIELCKLLGIYRNLTGVLIFMFLIFLVKALSRFSMGYFQARLNRKLTLKLRNQMYNSILNVDYQYFMKRNVGYFVTVMNGHLHGLYSSFNGFINFTTSFVMTASYVFLAGIISWEVALVSLLLGIVVVGALSVVVKRVKSLSKRIATLDKENSQIAIQALYAFKYLVSTYSFHSIRRIYSDSIKNLSQLTFRTNIANSFSKSLQELVTISLLISLILVEVVIMKKPMTSVFVILLLFYRGINQMLILQQNYQTLTTNLGNIESADNELSNLSNNREKNGLIKIENTINSGNIVMKDVYFKYNETNDYILKGVNLTIFANQTIGFVGPSGSGKSTLVDTITGLLKPEKGIIEINGIEIAKIDQPTLRSKIGYVNQDIIVFDDTIWNNISMFDINASERKIEDACRSANIWDFVISSENGLQTRIGDRGMRLSGGQKQRLSIARELYKNPELLILDEATSALDAESESIIKEAIDLLKGKITVIIIAHRLSTVKSCDCIYVINNGEIVESGNYIDLINQTGSRFGEMVNKQSLNI